MPLSSFERHKISLKNQLIAKKYFSALKAFHMAIDYHKDQYRDKGEPYVIHPFSLALNVTLLNIPSELEEKLLIVVLLHDVIEDCNVSADELRMHFDNDVVDAIVLMSKKGPGIIPMSDEERLIQMTKNKLGGLAKGIDRWNNLESMIELALHRQKKYVKETPAIIEMLKIYGKNFPELHECVLHVRKQLKCLVNMTSVNVKNCEAYEEKISKLEEEVKNLKELIPEHTDFSM